MRREIYCEVLLKDTTELDLYPLITFASDGKGRLKIYADKILTHEQKVQLVCDGLESLLEGIAKENFAISKAKILKPHEYRKID